MQSPKTISKRHVNQSTALDSRSVLNTFTGLALITFLAACNTTGRGSSESAPPPMKPIETGAPARSAPAPAPVAPPAASAPAPSVSSPAPVASAPVSSATTAKPSEPEPELKAIVVSAGLHRCELGKRVLVKRVASDGTGVQVNWGGKDYNLRSVPTQSGAKRFEDSKAGIAWVVISAKAFILDTKRGQMLANECKL
jgi:hypothetical protein